MMIPMAPSVDEVRTYMQGSKFSLEQVLQAVQLGSTLKWCIPEQRPGVDALACNAIRQGYCEASQCYYRTGIVEIVVDLLVNGTGLNVHGNAHFNKPDEASVDSPIFQKRFAQVLSKNKKRLNDTAQEVAEFLHVTTGTKCYKLSELPGRYLHQLLETECPQKQEDIPEEMVEKMRQLVIEGFDKLFEEDEPITINPLYYTLMRKNNLLDFYTPLDSPQIVSYRDHLVTCKDSAPIDPDKVVAYSRSCPVPVAFVSFTRNKNKHAAIREHFKKYPHVITIDKSSDKFEAGMTNFTVRNLCDCFDELGHTGNETGNMLEVCTDVFDKMDRSNLIDHRRDNKSILGIDLISTKNKTKGLSPGVFDSKIFIQGEHRATLRTREY